MRVNALHESVRVNALHESARVNALHESARVNALHESVRVWLYETSSYLGLCFRCLFKMYTITITATIAGMTTTTSRPTITPTTMATTLGPLGRAGEWWRELSDQFLKITLN